VKKFVLISMAVATVNWNAGAQAELDLSSLMETAEEWAAEHLDTNVVAALPAFDQQQAQVILSNLQQQFQGEFIMDLAALRGTVETLLPLLDAYEETEAYAAWLRPRLDYFKVATEFQSTNAAPMAGSLRPQANPSASLQREVWVREVSPRPWPPAASNLVIRLKPVFAEQKVPPELVWIAEVESSFDAKARSPVGAAGLFQLMPETAKSLGLSLWPRDQRYQPERSARAAAQYLNSLHRRFADWRLTLAAYNAGQGRVQRTLQRLNAKTYDEIAPHLPAETQMYVPKVEAVLLRREGVSLSALPRPGR
jgi:membrane-bound lytic murein transglycosylase D